MLKPITHSEKNDARSFLRWNFVWIWYCFVLLALLLIFLSYYAPDMMIAMTNQVWAFCGW